MKDTNHALVVMPAYNEASLIGDVVSGIIKSTGLSVLVVDDASTDNTAAQARSHGAQVLSLASQLGAWGATQVGLRYADNHDLDYVITIDADGQHDIAGIPVLLDNLIYHNNDVVIGSCTQRGSNARKIAWKILQLLSGLKIKDLTSGFRAYSKNSIKILASRDATTLDYQDIGVLCLLRHAGMRIAEIDVCMFPRKDGKSRIFDSWFSVGKYMMYSSILAISHSKYTGK